jgi:type II secretory pathway component PulK
VAPVNVNTASREVLMGVLGIAQESLVQLIRAQRNESPIRSIDQFYAQIGKTVPDELRPYLGVRSRCFAVDAQAYAEGRTERLRVLAQRDSKGNVDVVQWVF